MSESQSDCNDKQDSAEPGKPSADRKDLPAWLTIQRFPDLIKIGGAGGAIVGFFFVYQYLSSEGAPVASEMFSNIGILLLVAFLFGLVAVSLIFTLLAPTVFSWLVRETRSTGAAVKAVKLLDIVIAFGVAAATGFYPPPWAWFCYVSHC